MVEFLNLVMKICLLGASGSIGRQTIDVIENNPNDFTLVSFSVGHNHQIIDEILSNHQEVNSVYLLDEDEKEKYQNRYPHIKFFSGEEGLENLIKASKSEMVVNALVGFAGLVPSITAIKERKILALANKESLVVGGELINSLLKEYNGKMYPIDSEHSAIWKCLKVDNEDVEKIILTGSGGAFRKLNRDQLVNVTKDDALNHPTWKMGNKITIDSATMMNKGFELIEAYYLFGYKADKLDVILHDESILHSCVKYKSGLYRGEVNKPDMRNPIKFALYEGNIPFETETFTDFNDLKDLHFHEFNPDRYPLVGLAKVVIDKGGNSGAIINAANEVAVKAFLEDKISFLDIERIIFKTLDIVKYDSSYSLKSLLEANKKAIEVASSLIGGSK